MEQKALQSLLSHVDKHNKHNPIYLQITTEKNAVKEKNAAPVMIKLPNRVRNTSELRICLIVKEDQPAVVKQLEKENAPTKDMFTQIISLNKLKTKLTSRPKLEAFRKSVDLVLADHRIVEKHLPHVLGPLFYKSGKDMPVPIRIYKPYDPQDTVEAKKLARTVPDAQFVKHQVKLATKSAAMALVPGTNLSVQIGFADTSYDQLVENLLFVKKDVKKRVQMKSDNRVLGYLIKTPDSAALPC